jgi:hypothetical protein
VKSLDEFEKVVKKLERAYAEEKEKECEELHNAIATILTEKHATIQNTLYVLELLKFELLRAKYEQIMGNAVVPEGGGIKKDAKLNP